VYEHAKSFAHAKSVEGAKSVECAKSELIRNVRTPLRRNEVLD